MEELSYVYVYLHPCSRIPFYVGKGSDAPTFHRAYCHLKSANCHNKLFKNMIHEIQRALQRDPIIELIKNLSQAEAFVKEKELIKLYGRINIEENGTLCNRTSGGQGTTGRIWSAESRQKVSLARKGKKLSVEARARIREGNLLRFALHPVSTETRQKLGKIRRGKTHTAEAKAKVGQAARGRIQSGASSWQIIDPMMKLHDVYCLKRFCNERGFSWKAFSRSLLKKQPISKGKAKGWQVISKDSTRL